ncbi:hypothetical protein GCK72_003758 [Caenorhabditis remanei]|uniref:F-box domain-containing protein n=1 Tax=Caenorhabditis remanei TaxID=31234 RepID=A0A6A5HBI4_CAERE|nr:hypothetical protein GCK72_003758 [Caenorhabditis remanei]KAF1763813.1 hypothetical protein GCK72_003758 [Caenorhabditis remanei]
MSSWLPSFLHKKETKFPLPKLPDRPMKNVLQLMEDMEIIKLSTLSKKMSKSVGKCDFKPLSYQVDVLDRDPDVFTFFNERWISNVGLESRQLAIPDSAHIIQLIQTAFPDSQFLITMVISKTDSLNFKIREILLTDEVKKYCTKIIVHGGALTVNELDLFINLRGLKRELVFDGTDFPLEYNHFNAFTGTNVIYEDARWIKISDLCGLESSTENLNLGRNLFYSKHYNELFKFHVNGNRDICTHIQIDCVESALNFEKMFEGIATLKVEKAGKTDVTMIHTNNITRKRPVMGISFKNTSKKTQICIQTYSINTESNELQTKCYNILQKLNKKTDLEVELKQIETIEYALRGQEEVLKPIQAKKTRITKELTNVREELWENAVYSVDGNARISPLD